MNESQNNPPTGYRPAVYKKLLKYTGLHDHTNHRQKNKKLGETETFSDDI